MSPRDPPALALLGWKTMLALVFAASLASAFVAVNVFMADILTLQARWQVNQWQRNPLLQPAPTEIGKVRNALTVGLDWRPGDPQLIELRGYLYGVRAIRAQRLPQLRNSLLDEVIAHFQQSLSRRPMSPYAWIALAQALEMRDGLGPAFWSAYDRALAYGFREGGVQVRLVALALRHWDAAGSERQAKIQQIVNQARGGAKGEILRLLKVFGKESLRTDRLG